jgi:tetraacyldisaccharide 4'-kinase
VLEAHLDPDPAAVARLKGKRVLAFAGIGDPARFFRTLQASGIEVAQQKAFADHHRFSVGEIEAVVADAKRDDLILVTTEKDLVRLLSDAELSALASEIVPFPVTLQFDDAAGLRKFLADRLFNAREKALRR